MVVRFDGSLNSLQKNRGQPIIRVSLRDVKVMDFVIDSAILATAVIGSFGTAFMIQIAALRLILKAMNRR